jgi:hypothetical protein
MLDMSKKHFHFFSFRTQLSALKDGWVGEKDGVTNGCQYFSCRLLNFS